MESSRGKGRGTPNGPAQSGGAKRASCAEALERGDRSRSLLRMKYLPLFADLENANALVVGGGEQAAQRVRLLRKTDARITVVAERINAELRALAQRHAIQVRLRPFVARDLHGQRLVYSA